jgi:hypothetical protein
MCDSRFEYPLPSLPLWALIVAGLVSAGVAGYAMLMASTASGYNQDVCFKTVDDFKTNCAAAADGRPYAYDRVESGDVSAFSAIAGLFAAAAAAFFIVPCTRRRTKPPASPSLLPPAPGDYYEPPAHGL